MSTRNRAPRAAKLDGTTHANGNGNGSAARAPFDLTSRYMAETLTIDITDPADAALFTGMTWTIGSQFSKEARAAVLSATKLRLNAKGEIEADSALALADTILDQLVAVTMSWSGFVVAGVPLDCTPNNVRALLTDARTAWLRPQVQAGYLSLSRFFATASAT